MNDETTNQMHDYDILDQDPQTVIDVLREAQHGSYDGWTEEQKVTISAFLADIALAASLWK
jgi:hypothetical protein